MSDRFIDARVAMAEPLQIVPLRKAYLSRAVSAMQLVDRVLSRIAKWDDPALWISRASEISVKNRARELDALAADDPSAIERLPLFGIPFAVKDNIGVADMVTTAACPGFAKMHSDQSLWPQRFPLCDLNPRPAP